jgi:purine-binding chemotaxis protein CheW
MNLSEIRKKAQQEKAGAADAVMAPEKTRVAEAEPVAKAEEPWPEVLADLGPGVLPPSTPVEPKQSSQEFDPLAVLLAGRDAAGHDEELQSAGFAADVAGEFLELLCFRVAAEKYALNIMEIKEIIKPRNVTEVPRVPPFVSGVLSLRGIIIPVFDMRKRLGHNGAKEVGKERIVVVKKGNEFCGLLVDEVTQVVRIAAASIEPPPAVLDGIDRDFVGGIGRFEGQMLILLNLEKVLDVYLS